MILRVLSYNIHKGFSLNQSKFVLGLLKDAIKSLDLDVVFLQEVIGEHRRFQSRIAEWPVTSQFEFLADQVWPHFAYGKNALYDEGHHGNAILSRFPIVKSDNIDISASKFEKRGLLHCVIEHPATGQSLDCFCTHLDPKGIPRRQQVKLMFERVRELAGAELTGAELTGAELTGAGTTTNAARPFLLAGDFNDWNQRMAEPIRQAIGAEDVGVAKLGRLQRTFPSFLPLLSLDRIYSRGVMVRDVRVLRGAPWNRLSDHAPLVAELELTSANDRGGKWEFPVNGNGSLK